MGSLRQAAATDRVWSWSRRGRRLLSLLAAALSAAVLSQSLATPDSPKRVLQFRVDPNTAPGVVLETLPRLGPSRAEAIVRERSQGPFRSSEEIELRIKGIGPATRRAIEPYLRFEDPSDASPAGFLSRPTSPP